MGAKARVDPELELRKGELEALGFELVEETEDGLRARATWSYDWLAAKRPHSIRVRRVGTLTADRLEADLRDRPGSSGAAWEPNVVCYLADEVSPEAVSWIEGNRGGAGFFPVARRLTTNRGFYFAGQPIFWCAVLYPGLRFLGRRLLFPQLSRTAVREPRSIGLAFTVALLALAVVLALALLF